MNATRGRVTEWGGDCACDLCSNPAKFRWTKDGQILAAACTLHRQEVYDLLLNKYGDFTNRQKKGA